MRKIICIIAMALGLNAATLMTYEVVENVGNIDLKLSFDSPFDGEIFQTKENNTLKIILRNTSSNEKFTTQLRSNIISSFVIQNLNDSVEISIKGVKGLKATAGILEGGLMLNINFQDEALSGITLSPQQQAKDSQSTKEDKKSSGSILKFILFLLTTLVLAAIAFFIFKKIKSNKDNFNFKFDDYDEISPKQNENISEDGVSKKEEIKQHKEPKKEQYEEIYDTTNKTSQSNDANPNIIYQSSVSDEKDLLLIQKNGNIYLNFLSKDNEIPKDIYEKMIQDEVKFSEFLEICKNQDRL